MKLTKQDIDKVRHIEGFPIARDEDIIALSRPPYYTACPNPFIEDFIRENGTPYDEATDDYHREPFAADVSEGKNDPIYNAHSYHTKVPYKAIMRYILHYTNPGDIVFDGFCGTGMTGVAAQMCGSVDGTIRSQLESEMKDSKIQWGARQAILNDLSPAASFIATSYNSSFDVSSFDAESSEIITSCENEYGWMYKTQHVDQSGAPIVGLDGKPMMGLINYTVWSDVFVCPSCSHEIVYYDAAYDETLEALTDVFSCPHCASKLKKGDCSHAVETGFDHALGETKETTKQVPVLIYYQIGTKKHIKKPDAYDLAVVEKVGQYNADEWFPTTPMMGKGGEYWGDSYRAGYHQGISNVHHFYTKRNLIVLGRLWKISENSPATRIAIQSMSVTLASRLSRYNMGHRGNGPLSGTLYVPSLFAETNVFTSLRGKIKDFRKCFLMTQGFAGAYIGVGSTTDISKTVPENSVDYIFTDPPFGGNLNYSELSFMWEAWLRVLTNTRNEAIMNNSQGKGLLEYQTLMEQCFIEYYRILKPGRWMTVEFHNSQNSVWNAIQEALLRAGFVVADVRTLDKKQGSFKQVQVNASVKQDLVISAYKPKESFVRAFNENAGEPEMAWEFVRQHLAHVPIVADSDRDGKLEIVAERQGYLLFDRMVAWHIMNGIPVPVDAHTFYDGLRQRFLQRDGMFFLPDQVNEYDEKRAHMELDVQQLSFVVTDEKNAIAWLNYILRDGPKTYQEIQPIYLQELHQSKQEKMPELLDMLRENFVQDEKGAWYVPDLSNAADLAKVRRKALLKEFYDSCVPGKAKLKVFRMEAIRAGFDECWKARDFKTIVTVGEKLPEAVLQEDPALLMYYDNACARV